MALIPSFLKSDPKLFPIIPSEIQFFHQIKNYITIVSKYEDSHVQEKARNCVPWTEMTVKAINKLLKLKEREKESPIDIDTRDILLIDLLDWFKNHFFQWYDTPVCNKCHNNSKMSHYGDPQPTPEEIFWSASRVEQYRCDKCGDCVRFPRYNNPEKLLETRRGRCGEWANAFTLICRSLGYDSRLIIDWTDHVWTEVYSHAQKRWLHCDPCENTCDSPLVYEIGWNKKLTFCIAMSKYEVHDVTWRYSQDHESLKHRRSLICREEWVHAVLDKINNNLQLQLSHEQRESLKIRRLMELTEFIQIPNQLKTLKESEQKGRASGSKAWRLARHEIGSDHSKSQSLSYAFHISKDSKFSLTYNCVNDEYKYNNDIIKQWQSCAFKWENIYRKVENDWKMVYLSRDEGTDSNKVGTIIWKLTFAEECRKKWTKITICFKCETFQNGAIKLTLFSAQNSINIIPNHVNVIESTQLQVEDGQLSLEAKLHGGLGSNAWQHVQLFRQSLNDQSSHGLVIEVFYD